MAPHPRPSTKPKPKPKRKHPRLPSTKTYDPSTSGPPTGALRNSIRNLERLLKKAESLPADVRLEKERELNHYQLDLHERREREKRGKTIGRYHKIRFFERQKAGRRLRRLRSKLGVGEGGEESGGDEGEDENEVGEGAEESKGIEQREELKRRIQEAEVDLNYTIYSPLKEKYVSLFVDGAKEEEGEGAVEKRRERKPEWWFVVERAMREGKLDEVREGRWPADRVGRGGEQKKENGRDEKRRDKAKGESKEARGGKAVEDTNGIRRRGAAADNDVEDDDDSDGGFFE